MEEEYDTPEEYFKKLDHWIKQSKLIHTAAACFPYYLTTNYPNYFTLSDGKLLPENKIPTEKPIRETTHATASTSEQASEQVVGYEFVIAPLWKRFVAEMVDVALLLMLKVAITFSLLNIFDLDLSYEFDSDQLGNSQDESKFLTLAEILSLSSDLVALEVLMKIFVCLYEAIWTMKGRVYVGGATPGKLLLRLRIVHVEVLSISNTEALNAPGSPIKALIYPADNPGFRRAFLRAIAKNLVLALLFPVCFVFLFLKHNRTFYDVITKTVVVEENQAPIRRTA